MGFLVGTLDVNALRKQQHKPRAGCRTLTVTAVVEMNQ